MASYIRRPHVSTARLVAVLLESRELVVADDELTTVVVPNPGHGFGFKLSCGFVVSDVLTDGAAASAGVVPGMILRRVNGMDTRLLAVRLGAPDWTYLMVCEYLIKKGDRGQSVTFVWRRCAAPSAA